MKLSKVFSKGGYEPPVVKTWEAFTRSTAARDARHGSTSRHPSLAILQSVIRKASIGVAKVTKYFASPLESSRLLVKSKIVTDVWINMKTRDDVAAANETSMKVRVRTVLMLIIQTQLTCIQEKWQARAGDRVMSSWSKSKESITSKEEEATSDSIP